jgi:hypothetical protein
MPDGYSCMSDGYSRNSRMFRCRRKNRMTQMPTLKVLYPDPQTQDHANHDVSCSVGPLALVTFDDGPVGFALVGSGEIQSQVC